MSATMKGKVKCYVIEDAKRFYLPPKMMISSTCPKCGREHVGNLDGHYLSYPHTEILNIYDYYVNCDECGTDYYIEIEVQIVVKMRLANPAIKVDT